MRSGATGRDFLRMMGATAGVAVGAEYGYAIVGSPDRKHLWFLAR